MRNFHSNFSLCLHDIFTTNLHNNGMNRHYYNRDKQTPWDAQTNLHNKKFI